MLDPDIPPEVEGETGVGEAVARQTATVDPVDVTASTAAFTPHLWTTVIVLH